MIFIFLSNTPEVSYVEGTYVDNILCGQGKTGYVNGDVMHCIFGDGYINGPTKLYDKNWVLKRVCWFYRNTPTGIIWNFLTGGGFLVGRADATGNMTGDNIAFLYPDLRTALYGTFINGKMAVAQTCFVKFVTIQRHCK